MEKLGIELSPSVQRQCLALYVHRFTGDHRPSWTRQPMSNGKAYPLQFINDSDWLAHTSFTVTKSGELDKRYRACYSRPTWPNNPELR